MLELMNDLLEILILTSQEFSEFGHCLSQPGCMNVRDLQDISSELKAQGVHCMDF